jgi:hypothetical protein
MMFNVHLEIHNIVNSVIVHSTVRTTIPYQGRSVADPSHLTQERSCE